jgi:glycosyltransferase involved in cell wall biosynthesis
MNKKLVRITTIPMSLKYLLKGQLSFMGVNGFEVIMISSDGKELMDAIESEKCRHFIIPLTRKITPFRDVIAVFRLYLLLVRENPDIVHTTTPKAGIVGMLASFLARVPVRLHTVAGLPLMEASGLKRVTLNFVEKLTYKCSTNIYPNSFGLKNIILENRFTTEDKLKVIGIGSSNGIDTSYFDPELFSLNERNKLKSELGIEGNVFVFIFVGRLVADKGINELVEAFVELCIVVKGIKLLLVGPFEDELDPLSDKTNQLISNHDKIILVGYQNDVRPFFAISNSLVFPSYREGFPNVVMQAGAMGLPGIVSDINGCNEIIHHDYNGIVVPSKDVESLRRAMSRIFQDKEFYLKCSARSRLAIVNNYEQKLYWKSLLNEYESVLNI